MLIPRAGEQLGDFELIRRIGAGGMGVVYEARQLSTGRRVALKILSPAMTREKNRLRFLREAEAASRLNHPNIVAVYAIRQDPELCYYAMELIDGWPMSRVLERLGVVPPTTLPLTDIMRTHAGDDAENSSAADTIVEEMGPRASQPRMERSAPVGARGPSILVDLSYVRQIVTMIRDIARALHYAHSQGVTHRDIKPDNLLLDYEGKLHLVDFGLARVMEEDNITLTGELMGTPLYMSPEQVAAGRIGIDHRTDLYSLGVVMYHLLCLQPPYEASTRESLLRAIVIHSPMPLSSRNPAVALALEAIVHHAMEKDPDRRYASGAAMADDLDSWLAGRPISLRTPGPVQRWWRRRSRAQRRVLTGTLGLAALISLAVPAISSFRRNQVDNLPPIAKVTSLEKAAHSADIGNYGDAALFFADGLRRGSALDGTSAISAAVVLHELPVLRHRFGLNHAGRPWDADPKNSRCTFAGADERLHTWILGADLPAGGPFGWGRHPEWISYDASGSAVWVIERGSDGQALGLWNPSGDALAAKPLTWPDRIRQIRTAGHGTDFTAAIMTAAPPNPAKTSAPRQDLNIGVYLFKLDGAPSLRLRMRSDSPIELNPDGSAFVSLPRSDVLEITSLDPGKRSIPSFSFSSIIGQVTYSMDGKRLAVADTSGEIAVARTTGEPLSLPMLTPSVNLRARTAPAYIRFSPDGKWILAVGAELQSSPPFLRSIELMDTDSYKTVYQSFGRDAYFTDAEHKLISWDDSTIRVLDLPVGAPSAADRVAGDAPPRVLIEMNAVVHARFSRPESTPVSDSADSDLRPVWTDAEVRRLLCAEADDEPEPMHTALSVYDLDTQEWIWRWSLPAQDVGSVGIDPTGQFAIAHSTGPDPRLSVWDLRDPDEPYPRSTLLPAVPISLENLRIAQGPLIAMLSREQNQLQWAKIDPVRATVIGERLRPSSSVEDWLLSEDGSTLVESGGTRVVVHAFTTGALIYDGSLPVGASGVAAISPDGKALALRCPDRRLRLFAPATASLLPLEFEPPAFSPERVRFSKSGRMIAAWSKAGRIALYALPEAAKWEVAGAPEAKPLTDINAGGRIGDVQLCQNDRVLVLGHTGGAASVWSIPSGRLLGRLDAMSVAGSNDGSAIAGLETRIGVRDSAIRAMPALLATAIGNRISLWRLPDAANPPLNGTILRAGPSLATTQGIIAISFPVGAGSTSSPTTSPAAAELGERILVVTDHAAIRWFDLSVPSWSPQEWQNQLTARTGAQLAENEKAELVRIPADELVVNPNSSRPATLPPTEANR